MHIGALLLACPVLPCPTLPPGRRHLLGRGLQEERGLIRGRLPVHQRREWGVYLWALWRGKPQSGDYHITGVWPLPAG